MWRALLFLRLVHAVPDVTPLYAPTQPYFDRTRVLPDIEEVKS